MLLIIIVFVIAVVHLASEIEIRVTKNRDLERLHQKLNREQLLEQIMLVLQYQEQPLNYIKSHVAIDPLLITKILNFRHLNDPLLIYQELTKPDYQKFSKEQAVKQQQIKSRYQKILIISLIVLFISYFWL